MICLHDMFMPKYSQVNRMIHQSNFLRQKTIPKPNYRAYLPKSNITKFGPSVPKKIFRRPFKNNIIGG